ncbi:MAG: nuclear transport factor 2 family protein [Pseudomonadota bacterium]
MSEKIAAFFEAWATADADAVRAAVTDPCYYADPRAPKPITEVDALIEYVGQYSQMAPGATAQVVRTDEVQGALRLAGVTLGTACSSAAKRR